MEHQPMPVKRDDPEERVLLSILSALEVEDRGVEDIVEGLRLRENPAGAKILRMAINDGMVEIVDDGKSLRVNDFGREIANKIRNS